MTPQQVRQIDELECAFEAFGYLVVMTPIAGEEDTFINALRAGFAKIEATLAFNARTYGFRGKSKRAVAALQADLPQPTWGVELMTHQPKRSAFALSAGATHAAELARDAAIRDQLEKRQA